MTTQTPRTDPAGTDAATGTPSRARTLVTFSAAGLAVAGIVAGLVMGFSGGTPGTTPAAPQLAPISHSTGYVPAHDVTPAKPVTPVAPSAAVETLQQELGQLNYYEGPVTGVMNAQTTQAITYLQRDAGLPQTGAMNTATQAALHNFLVDGNNHMGG
ncbi:peptidoglycan-binding domain-containing protein [Pseudonocardia sp.]|jgi:peptidoglycan hydrolase-like protein with peptidoglycan-binding domain|uniref:peptidoglycan-binding domain-containing protein n=1 Tax=Pseudonocardia sp. TaxID=60912 RepID=UPI003D11CE97